MENTSTAMALETTQEMEDAFARLLMQIKEVREQMKASDVIIRQIDAEYALLKAESQILRKQTENILANAWSML